MPIKQNTQIVSSHNYMYCQKIEAFAHDRTCHNRTSTVLISILNSIGAHALCNVMMEMAPQLAASAFNHDGKCVTLSFGICDRFFPFYISYSQVQKKRKIVQDLPDSYTCLSSQVSRCWQLWKNSRSTWAGEQVVQTWLKRFWPTFRKDTFYS